jgi:hypothetical protein
VPSLTQHQPCVLCPLQPVSDRHQPQSSPAATEKKTRLVLVLVRARAVDRASSQDTGSVCGVLSGSAAVKS